MRSISGSRLRWSTRRSVRTLPYDVMEVVLVLALVAAGVALFWSLVRPMGSVGRWQAASGSVAGIDSAILTRFDPFFRSVPSGVATVTSLQLTLFGVRLDQAMGRGSAIIATPDGAQNSFAVGDEIVPGVRLKSVALDSVMIERSGTDEQLFLDQSAGGGASGGAAPLRDVPGRPSAGIAPVVTAPATASVPSPQLITASIAFAPRLEKGAVTGFVVGPKGNGEVFKSSGLRAGDVVTQINGKGIRSTEDATAALVGAGAQATLTVERDGKAIAVTLGAAK